MNCKYCGKPADGIAVVLNVPICIECLYENKEYTKHFNKNGNYDIEIDINKKDEPKKKRIQESFI